MADTGDRRIGIDVRNCGAAGDGRTDDSGAIQSALDAGAGLVVVPAGTYLIGATLRISSNTRLILHPAAHMVLADGVGTDTDSFLLANARGNGGDRNIWVEGGIWDGNNPGNRRGPDVPGAYTGAPLDFRNVDGLVLRSLTIRDAECYYIRIGEARNFLVEDITFQAPNLRPNQDGVHLGGFCEDGVIRRLRADGPGCTNDDMVALNADDGMQRAQNLGLRCGPIRRIRIEDVRAESCHSFVRLLSVESPIEDITIDDVVGGARACAVNVDACRQCRVRLFEGEDEYPAGVGQIRRVTIRRMRVHKAPHGSPKALLDLTSRLTDFRLREYVRDYERDADPAAPTMTLGQMDPCDVELRGITATQADAAAAAEGVAEEGRRRMAATRQRDVMATHVHISRAGSLLLPEGGFETLLVNVADPAAPF
jgi:polygalacturonase